MSDAVTQDCFLGGRLRLLQPARGHRAGTDAALLQAAVAPDFTGEIADLGAGVGAVGLSVAIRAPGARVTLVEVDAVIADLARQNIALNGLGDRVRVIEADATLTGMARAEAGLLDRSVDMIVTNPPFHDEGRMRVSPDRYRALAHGGGPDLLDAWTRSAAAMLVPGGDLVMIHRADAVPHILETLGQRFGRIRLLPVLPRVGTDASRVIVRAAKGSRAPFRLLPPLVLHGDAQVFTPRAAALHQGDAVIEWETVTG